MVLMSQEPSQARALSLRFFFLAVTFGPLLVTANQSSPRLFNHSHQRNRRQRRASKSRIIRVRGGESEDDAKVVDSRRLRKNTLNLDLSGRAKWLLLKSRSDTSTAAKPLLDKPSPYTVFAGVDYDFQNYWYGISRLISGIRIKLNSDHEKYERRPLLSKEKASFLPSWLKPRNLSRGAPYFADIEVEKGVLGNDGYAATQISFSWDDEPLLGQEDTSLASQGLSLSIRLDSENAVGCSLSLPIQSRLLWRGRIVRKYDRSRDYGPMELKLPSPNIHDPSKWLIPNLSVNTLGDLQTKNQLWMASTSDERQGLRLTIRRRCAFDFLTTATQQGNEWTWVGLEVEGRGTRSRSVTRLEAALEAPLASAQMVVSQDWII